MPSAFDGTDLSLAFAAEQVPPQPSQDFLPPPPPQPQPLPLPPYQPQQHYTLEPSLWDRMVEKRDEVVRLFILSLVILLAISFDRFFSHYIQEYVSRSVLSDSYEILLRGAYPLGILLLLWVIKSM